MSSDENENQKTAAASALKTAWSGPVPSASAVPAEDMEFDIDEEMLEFMSENADFNETEVEQKPLPEEKSPTPPIKKSRKVFHPEIPSPKIMVITAITVCALIAIFSALQIPAIAKSKIESKLQAAGFPQARVNNISLSPSSISANDIKLDEYGFDEIKNLKADISWPVFITSGDVSGLNITGIHLGRDAANINAGVKQFMANLLLLPAYRISVNDATVDITTDFGELRVNLDSTVATDQENGIRTIKARIQSSQYQLSFDSSWNGTLTKEGNLDLSAEVVDGRLNIGPLRISRFNGWIGTDITAGKSSMETQMEAGSASFMDVPIQTLSLVSAYRDGETNLVFRSGVSGMPDVLFTADMIKKDNAPVFNAALTGKNLGMLLDYIEEATGHVKNIRPELIEAGQFQFSMNFEPEKRFVGGPLPFSLSLLTDGDESVKGNVLYYPDTLEVRGALETEMGMASALQDYFKIPSTSMSQNFIRVDGDIRRFFYFGETPADTPLIAPTETP